MVGRHSGQGSVRIARLDFIAVQSSRFDPALDILAGSNPLREPLFKSASVGLAENTCRASQSRREARSTPAVHAVSLLVGSERYRNHFKLQ